MVHVGFCQAPWKCLYHLKRHRLPGLGRKNPFMVLFLVLAMIVNRIQLFPMWIGWMRSKRRKWEAESFPSLQSKGWMLMFHPSNWNVKGTRSFTEMVYHTWESELNLAFWITTEQSGQGKVSAAARCDRKWSSQRDCFPIQLYSTNCRNYLFG